ncbi:PLP-dependent transferase [Thiospirochaeta perfilievii]|uniref:PLP-dependent transferase n=1 Tax=Thiospirochaeta perfilievii TaxID=252967 RepID=A0A5C1Q823_9SPIO|nr:PLP-dependent transferase [Thiospirochaeta perfilievii]QEN04233.1 PLP-dependent transferase [Thiospirochaeta perfilievii]
MNKSYYTHIPLGDSIPLNNPHAFSVSMPTIQDVIDYEEGTQVSKEKIKTAYPRILIHPYIKKVCSLLEDKLSLCNGFSLLLPSKEAAIEVSEISGVVPSYYNYKKYTLCFFNNSLDVERYFSFMKHCGYMIYSREAEDLLIDLGEDCTLFFEQSSKNGSESTIKEVLKEGYDSREIVLSSSGMNSIYTGFKQVKEFFKESSRGLFIVYGWAYADTLAIFKKCCDEYVIIPDVTNTEELEFLLEKRGDEVVGLYLESVSNPLISVPDIPKVYELSEKYNFLVMVDNTFATPWSVDISSYCDIIFESLTKFASGYGDVMAGATIIPKKSRVSPKVIRDIKNKSIPLYLRDLNRLSLNIKGYKKRVLKVLHNSKIVEDKLLNSPKIKSVYSVNSEKNKTNWDKISRGIGGCGVISFIYNKDFENQYNMANIPKGPSLGCEFPILMPYTLLAHYTECQSSSGLKYLSSLGLDRTLLRLSVGTDSPSLTLNQILKLK